MDVHSSLSRQAVENRYVAVGADAGGGTVMGLEACEQGLGLDMELGLVLGPLVPLSADCVSKPFEYPVP